MTTKKDLIFHFFSFQYHLNREMRSMSLRLMEIYIFYGKLMKISIKRVFIQFFRFTTVAEIPIYEEKIFPQFCFWCHLGENMANVNVCKDSCHKFQNKIDWVNSIFRSLIAERVHFFFFEFIVFIPLFEFGISFDMKSFCANPWSLDLENQHTQKRIWMYQQRIA